MTLAEDTTGRGPEIRRGPANSQITDVILMIEPTGFGFNPETAVTNSFQNQLAGEAGEIQTQAQQEFRDMVARLRKAKVNVVTVPSAQDTPDAVFPNNWISFHDSGAVALYPMRTPNRRRERQLAEDVMDSLSDFIDSEEVLVRDFSRWEEKNEILEGTGSMVLDRTNKVAYAVTSPRTTEPALRTWCHTMNYEPVIFNALDAQGKPIYHTNVVMSVGEGFSVVCLEAIPEAKQRARVEARLKDRGVVMPITRAQMNAFCGNILQVQSFEGEKMVVMSKTAHAAFTPEQRLALRHYGGEILAVIIPTIETIGGGSARCMMAEVFTPNPTTR